MTHKKTPIDSLSQEQTVAVEKDLFNIVPQDYDNKLPVEIKDSENINQFKKRL